MLGLLYCFSDLFSISTIEANRATYYDFVPQNIGGQLWDVLKKSVITNKTSPSRPTSEVELELLNYHMLFRSFLDAEIAS